MKVKDLQEVINPRCINIIYENHWTGVIYKHVDDETKIGLILPIDDKTLKVTVTI